MEMPSRECQWGTTKRTHRIRSPQMPTTLMIVGLSEGLPEVNFVGEHAYIAAICGVLMVGGILISLVFTSFAVRKFLRMNTSNANLY